MSESTASMLIGLAAAAGALAAVVLLVRRAAIGGGDFEIKLGPGDRVEVLGRVPRSKVPGIRGFFRSQPGGVPLGRITGRFGPSGTPRLRFSGRIGEELRQRSRNFLIEHLR